MYTSRQYSLDLPLPPFPPQTLPTRIQSQGRRPPRACTPVTFRRHGIVRRGLYAFQLRHWLRYFPPDQIMVINHDQVESGVGLGLQVFEGLIQRVS